MSRHLVAILGTRATTAGAVERAWDDGDAVAVLDPSAPPAVVRSRLDALAPTHIVDDNRHRRADGISVDDDVAAVVMTSGTSSVPRAVTLTWEGMRAMARGASSALDTGNGDTWLCCLPLHHVAGLAILARHRLNDEGLVLHENFDIDAVSQAPRKVGASIVSLVPTMLQRILDAGAPVDGYRVLLLGGAAVPADLRERAHAVGGHVVASYGMTETWGGCVHDGVADEGVTVRIADDREIQVRGDVVMPRYHRDPDRTRAAFTDDGWFRTGDLGALVEEALDGKALDGSPPRLRVTDRRDDMIISGGVNVSPTQVEAALSAHPGVDDVGVIGTPDEEWGERVVAHVVPRDPENPPTLADLREFGSERLSAASLPREIHSVREIPRTASGKIRRGSLRSSCGPTATGGRAVTPRPR